MSGLGLLVSRVDLRSISSPVHELGNEPIRSLGLRPGRVSPYIREARIDGAPTELR
jgi:hypothetical protein